jgi:hypothetical protein
MHEDARRCSRRTADAADAVCENNAERSLHFNDCERRPQLCGHGLSQSYFSPLNLPTCHTRSLRFSSFCAGRFGDTTLTPSSRVAPMPMRTLSSIVHECRLAWCPMVTLFPIVAAPELSPGAPCDVLTVAPSCRLELLPTVMGAASPAPFAAPHRG